MVSQAPTTSKPPVNGTRWTGSKRYSMPPDKANIGNVRIPPGRFVGDCAKKPSNASPRKKLNPRSRPKFMAEGAAFIGGHLGSGWNQSEATLADLIGSSVAVYLDVGFPLRCVGCQLHNLTSPCLSRPTESFSTFSKASTR